MKGNLFSRVFSYLPEGRLKNIIRWMIYNLNPKLFFKIRYNFFRDVWEIREGKINLQFKQNPYHTFKTNPLFLKYLPEWQPDIIIDAGAYHGTVGLYLAKKFPSAVVYLLEPDPISFAVLEKNIKLNRVHGAVAIRKALWDKEGLIQFQSGQELSSKILEEKVTGSVTIEAISPQKLLGNCMGERIFVKMNIEGAELETVPSFFEIWRKNKLRMVVAADHYINGELTYKKIENWCLEKGIEFKTEQQDIYKDVWIFCKNRE